MLEDAVEDPHASRVLLQLLCPNSRRYLPPAVLTMLHPPQRTVVGTSGNMVTDIEGDEFVRVRVKCVETSLPPVAKRMSHPALWI
eukprot:scaffold253027_cov22-Tisochrysis_lutea.AAC.1